MVQEAVDRGSRHNDLFQGLGVNIFPDLKDGNFRPSRVMAEIKRLWSNREIAKSADRKTLERLEAKGRIVRARRVYKRLFLA